MNTIDTKTLLETMKLAIDEGCHKPKAIAAFCSSVYPEASEFIKLSVPVQLAARYDLFSQSDIPSV